LVGIGLVVNFLGLLIGLAFMFIFQGGFLLLLALTPFWKPADMLFGKLSLSSLGNMDSLPWWKWPFVLLILLPWLFQIAAGIFILSQMGLKNQNLIIMLFLK
jgi:hypothetical protein